MSDCKPEGDRNAMLIQRNKFFLSTFVKYLSYEKAE